MIGKDNFLFCNDRLVNIGKKYSNLVCLLCFGCFFIYEKSKCLPYLNVDMVTVLQSEWFYCFLQNHSCIPFLEAFTRVTSFDGLMMLE